MSGFSEIDLSQLPAPEVIGSLDFETILDESKTYLISLFPADEQTDITEKLALESEPMNKVCQAFAYRELLLRQRVNEAAQALMLAYSSGSDLDQLGANVDVERNAGETDTSFRRRIQLSFEGFSTAGPSGAYLFHALSADTRVVDVGVNGPADQPGVVQIAVLSSEGDGTATEDLLTAVSAVLSADDVRPLTDEVQISSVEIISYAIEATLIYYSGPDSTVVKAAALAAATSYAESSHQMGRDITLSGIYAALHQSGVQNVILTSPAADLVIGWNQAAWCSGISLTDGGTDE